MENLKNAVTLLLLMYCFMIVPSSLCAQSDIYWVGGNGDWHDATMWYKDQAGTIAAGTIPGPNHIVHFTDDSSTSAMWNVRLQPGSYEVHSILVETSDNFRIYFNGTDNNEVDLTVYGDILLLSSHRLEYASTFQLNNKWIFEGANNHDITTGDHDLSNVEIKDIDGIFNQLDDLTASQQIRIFAGTWNSNSNDVTAGKILFEDDEPSSSPLTKLFNCGTSTILCLEWESGFTYGSLTVTGTYTIRTKRFRGSPKQGNGIPFTFHNIHLLEYPDIATGTPIEYNNFECRGCIVNDLIIFDTGDTKLADEFTLNGKFEIRHLGSSILFNGGNSRNSEVTINGSIKTPDIVLCSDPLTIFSSIHTDESIFKRSDGTLSIENAIVNNIQTETSGSAQFDLEDGILQGASTGWNLISTASSLQYIWVGSFGTIQDWDDPNMWETPTGNNGCLPTLADDVYIDPGAKGDIRIPAGYNAMCRDFFWSNKNDLELLLDGTNVLESALTVGRNFELDESATISAVDRHEIYFSSTTSNQIKTNGVLMPEVLFIGNTGAWSLESDLHSTMLTFEAGTFITNGHDVRTDVWNAFEEYPKYFYFGSSRITVDGEMDLAEFETRNVTVYPGSSLIKCEKLNCIVEELYDVQFNNTSTLILGNENYSFNSLILNGTGEVQTTNDLTVNQLVFRSDDSSLAINPAYELIINEGMTSLTSIANPGILKSTINGTQVDVRKGLGNLCATGPIEFKDIKSDFSGTFHAPDGIDDGNNTDIVFDSGSSSNTLYWIATNGGTWHQESNWSQVDGGCPASKDPSLMANLEFNRNSFAISPVTVTVPLVSEAKHVTFKNAESLMLEVANFLEFEDLVIDGGYLNLAGDKLDVTGETTIQSSGFMTNAMNTFRTDVLNVPSGVHIVRDGSETRVRD